MVVNPTAGILEETETTQLYKKTLALNEALMLGSMRQHELTEAAENLIVRLQLEITARTNTARELAEKARLLDLSNDAIIVRDFEGRILYWNHGAEELYGWSRAEALGQVVHALLQTKFPKPIEQITEELNRDNRWAGEMVHTKRDGERITVFVRKSLDRDAGGNPAAVLETLSDITKRKQAEEALHLAQAQLLDRAGQLEGLVVQRTAELTATNKQLEAFVYTIAHDLRAPLRSMQSFSEMLVIEAGDNLSAKSKDCVARINKSAQFMDALLRDLLDFSHISQRHVKLIPVKLETVVESLLSRLQEDIQEKNARVESAGPWPVVLGHESTLAHVLLNLVSNALKFVAPGLSPAVRLRAEERGDFIRIWVEDNGPGIAPDYQGQIFGLFTRLDGDKFEGTGIGLAIVQKGVERMNGRVGVESAPGEGSRFWFELHNSR